MERFFTARPKQGEDIFSFMSRMDKYKEEITHLQHLALEAGETLKMPKFCRVSGKFCQRLKNTLSTVFSRTRCNKWHRKSGSLFHQRLFDRNCIKFTRTRSLFLPRRKTHNNKHFLQHVSLPLLPQFRIREREREKQVHGRRSGARSVRAHPHNSVHQHPQNTTQLVRNYNTTNVQKESV